MMQGWSPLHLAVHNKNIDFVALLLDNEADVDAKSLQVRGSMRPTSAKSST